jgi:hypothetical protein
MGFDYQPAVNSGHPQDVAAIIMNIKKNMKKKIASTPSSSIAETPSWLNFPRLYAVLLQQTS